MSVLWKYSVLSVNDPLLRAPFKFLFLCVDTRYFPNSNDNPAVTYHTLVFLTVCGGFVHSKLKFYITGMTISQYSIAKAFYTLFTR